MAGEPGMRLSGAATMTQYVSPSGRGMGMVGERAVWAARVVTFDMSGSGAVIGVGATLRGAPSWRSARTRPVPQGSGRADGCRDGVR
jgi:hypothetical protein